MKSGYLVGFHAPHFAWRAQVDILWLWNRASRFAFTDDGETSPWLEKLHKYSNIWHDRPKQSSVFSLAYPVAFSRGRYNWTLDVYGKWHLRITVLMWAICMFCSSCLLVMCVMSFALGIWTGTRWTLWPCNMNQGGFYIFIFCLKGIVHPNIKKFCFYSLILILV